MPADFGLKGRDVDNVEGMCWLYGQTGDARLLEIAKRTFENYTRSPNSKWRLENLSQSLPMTGHGVSVCEVTKQPAILYLYTGDKKYLDAVVGGFVRWRGTTN